MADLEDLPCGKSTLSWPAATNSTAPGHGSTCATWEIDPELAGSNQGPIPIVTTPAEKTWVWSDLDFGDRGARYAFQGPFGDVDQRNRHLLREWRRRVRSDDTIICLGDVAHPDAWRDRRLVLDIRDCPGKGVLVLGNHRPESRGSARGGIRHTVLAGAARH